jgi:hypothetical protein
MSISQGNWLYVDEDGIVITKLCQTAIAGVMKPL